MMICKSKQLVLIGFFTLLFAERAESCSMYKVTAHNKTMVGSNFDAYYLTSRIWFETAKKPGEYGAAFSGGRLEGPHGYSPQSGMNESGLFFCGAAVPPVDMDSAPRSGKKQIVSRASYLKEILHRCKTIDEVKELIGSYDRSPINADIFLYVDRSGRYLIVEPDTMIIGTDSQCALSNFCRSTTSEADARKMSKYRRGADLLKNRIDSGLAFCTHLSDTMSVCRAKMGDGTLLTNIADLNDGILYYYFYHNFKQVVRFNLKDELAKGDHVYEVPALFPGNAEYEKFRHFQTPQHSDLVLAFMFASAGIFLLSSLYFFISFFIKLRTTRFAYVKLFLSLLGVLLAFYSLVLIRNEQIFYFPVPYKDYTFSILNVAAYIPFLLLLAIVPLLLVIKKIFKGKLWGKFPRWMFAVNNLIFLFHILLFAYWGLFNIFN
jgi:hypothetical protein